MKLDKISTGRVYADTNVLYMYLRSDPNHLSTIRVFLERMTRGEIETIVGVPVMDELFYRLLLARVKDTTGRNPLEALRDDLTGMLTIHAGVIETAIRKLIALPHLVLVGVETTDFSSMLDNIGDFSLLPRDALHLAIIQRLGLSAIVSDDTDFDRVDGLERHWVINPPP